MNVDIHVITTEVIIMHTDVMIEINTVNIASIENIATHTNIATTIHTDMTGVDISDPIIIIEDTIIVFHSRDITIARIITHKSYIRQLPHITDPEPMLYLVSIQVTPALCFAISSCDFPMVLPWGLFDFGNFLVIYF